MARPPKLREFDREAPKIGRVAAAPQSPEQLNLDELLPGRCHGWDRVVPTDYGYVASCKCGWRAREMPTKRAAYYQMKRHLARTPQGQGLLKTLRKVGRAGNGA